MSNESDEPLPDDLPACHSLIRELRLKVANLRRVVVGTLGYDPTDTVGGLGHYQPGDEPGRFLQVGSGAACWRAEDCRAGCHAGAAAEEKVKNLSAFFAARCNLARASA